MQDRSSWRKYRWTLSRRLSPWTVYALCRRGTARLRPAAITQGKPLPKQPTKHLLGFRIVVKVCQSSVGECISTSRHQETMTDSSTPSVKSRTRSHAKSRVEVPRDRILRSSAHLFRKKGYKGTTVRDIAEEVGILSGSLFHHFATRSEILLEIMREAFLSVCLTHEEVLARESDPVKQFRELVRHELDAILSEDRQDFHAVLYFDWREAPEAALPELNRLRKRYRNCWHQALMACHEEGKLRCPPDIAEHVVDGALRGVMSWFRKGGRYTTEAFGDAFAHLFIE